MRYNESVISNPTVFSSCCMIGDELIDVKHQQSSIAVFNVT